MCSAKVAAEFKKKGDWCEKHDRAKSQCFICDPSLEAKYAARYEAKYGKKPPPPRRTAGPEGDQIRISGANSRSGSVRRG